MDAGKVPRGLPLLLAPFLPLSQVGESGAPVADRVATSLASLTRPSFLFAANGFCCLVSRLALTSDKVFIFLVLYGSLDRKSHSHHVVGRLSVIKGYACHDDHDSTTRELHRRGEAKVTLE